MKIEDYQNTLANKTVLITGAGGGIGFETAKNFAMMGAKVIILEIDKKKEKMQKKLSIQFVKEKPNSTT